MMLLVLGSRCVLVVDLWMIGFYLLTGASARNIAR
jgi:hypothetical protein